MWWRWLLLVVVVVVVVILVVMVLMKNMLMRCGRKIIISILQTEGRALQIL